MRLRNLSIASLLLIPTPAIADTIFMCQSCAPGTYGDGTGTSCKKCEAGSYSTGGAESCTSCSKGQYQNATGQSTCKPCNSATHPTSVSGKNCGAYTVDVTSYCQAEGSISATGNSKVTGTTTINLGSCSGHSTCVNNVCTNCSNPPSNASWASSSSCDWQCNAGYRKDGSSCTACGNGYYKAEAGNAQTCSACSNKPMRGSEYTDNATTARTSNTCGWGCSIGWGYDNGGCYECGAGYTKTSVGNTACTECTGRPTGSEYTTKNSCAWRCLAGFGYSNNTCTACGVGYTKTSAGNTACTKCTNGPSNSSYTTPNSCSWICKSGHYLSSNSCQQCPANSTSQAGSTKISDCNCNSGYFKHNNNCYITLDDNYIYTLETGTGDGTKYERYIVYKYNALDTNTYTQTKEISLNCSSEDPNKQYSINLFFGFNSSCSCGTKCSCNYRGMYVKYKGNYIPISEVYTYKFDHKIISADMSHANICYFNHSITRIK